MQRWGRQGDKGKSPDPERAFLRVTGRALALRCPRCGNWGIFRTWFRLQPECPTCGLSLERGESEDHWFGAVAVNLVAAELLGIGAIIVWIVAAWPERAAGALTAGPTGEGRAALFTRLSTLNPVRCKFVAPLSTSLSWRVR